MGKIFDEERRLHREKKVHRSIVHQQFWELYQDKKCQELMLVSGSHKMF